MKIIKNEIMEIIKEKNIELKEQGKNIYIIWIKNRYFKGIAKCQEIDRESYSSLLGGEIARLRALRKLVKYQINQLKNIPDTEKLINELQCKYNLIPEIITSTIEDFYSGKTRVKKFKERKKQGIKNRREELQHQVNALLELKKQCEKAK
jgi:hypothetical protein